MEIEMISHGAEAKIFTIDDYIIKFRTSKSYRIAELDKNIIKKRTKKEGKILKKLYEQNVNVPKTYKYEEFIKKVNGAIIFKNTKDNRNKDSSSNDNSEILNSLKDTMNNDNTIILQKIKGITISEYIKNSSAHQISSLLCRLGTLVNKIHDCNIVHGDLTLNNFIVNDEIFAIDFGLSCSSSKDEDKAVDLYVFERALLCTFECGVDSFYEGYKNQAVIKRLEVVRKRGRKREENAFG